MDYTKYQQTPPELLKRNQRMATLRAAGASLGQLAQLYNLSRERCRQIVEREFRKPTKSE